MKDKNNHGDKSSGGGRAKYTKDREVKQVYKALYKRPISRRMAATQLGYIDQTYMVTQIIFDMIEDGRAQVVGRIRCKRSQRFVEAVTTNPEYFRSNDNNELETFE